MKTFKYIIFVSAILMTAWPVFAQVGYPNAQSQIDVLRHAMEQTDQILEQAYEIVRASGSPIAKNYLEQAVKMQREAWHNFHLNTLIGYQQAKRQTELSRELAKRAIDAGRITEDNEDVVLRKLEQLKEMLEQIQEFAGHTATVPQRALFETARNNLKLAWEFYRNGQFRASLKLCNQVEKAIKTLMNNQGGIDRQQSMFEHHSGNFEKSLEKYRELSAECNSEQSKKIFENAKDAYQHALGLSRENNYDAALQALRQAQRMLQRAINECRGSNDLQARYDYLKNRADRIKENSDPSNEQVSRQLELIYAQLEQAKSFIDTRQTEAAAAALKAAQLALRRLDNND